jgi:hypothetical protein
MAFGYQPIAAMLNTKFKDKAAVTSAAVASPRPTRSAVPAIAEAAVRTGKVLYPIVLDYSEEFLPNEIGTGVQKRRADNARPTV